ncbi:Major facilitator superfamily domain-containing protein [Pleurostoma richardsiae]|uniref:Major facilitator superfamily domain-containing protein n=1 Tax=Pleurostoma richardsiae TaxID=41990 RepID=A0AA38VL11_9PEZI|nr:Major facilitator superfamily domain-containing protein [Pleurostoma richardsiae]
MKSPSEPATTTNAGLEPIQPVATNNNDNDVESLKNAPIAVEISDEGARRIELVQLVWGNHGKLVAFSAIALCMVVYELDVTTFNTYWTYALSDFQSLASSAALAAAGDLAFSLVKPIYAKTSDIVGRGYIYPFATTLACIGLIVAATSKGFPAFAVGTILRLLGLSGINSMNAIVIADVTTTRQRGFGVTFQFWPYLILPWVVSYMVSKVVSPGGIGWAWGIGITAIIFPIGTVFITTFLLKNERRAKKLELVSRPKISFYQFCSHVDLGGLAIMIISLAFILVPLSIASLQKHGYRTPWIIALIIIGGLGIFLAFPLYEGKVAVHPIFPLRYARHRAIGLAFLIYFTDAMAAAASHGYLYNWALIAHNFTILEATNLNFINSVLTFFSGMIFGLIIWRTRTYKWWILAGCVIRLVGYGVMFRIRSGSPTMAEIFIVQVIQGVGDGIVQIGGYVAATINVPHSETAQMTALVVTIGMLGTSVGNAISGAIYTGTFREQLAKELGSKATPELISNVFNSITVGIPAWGTPERTAINIAYNSVTSFFFIAAMAIIVPGFVLVYFLPNQKLNDSQNLLEDHGMFGNSQQIIIEGHATRTGPRAPETSEMRAL